MSVLADHSSRTRKVRSWPPQNPPPLYIVVRDPRFGPPKPPRHVDSCQLRKPSICAGSSPDLHNRPPTNHLQPCARLRPLDHEVAARRTSKSLDTFNFESTSECSTSEYFTPPTSAASIWELWNSDNSHCHALVGPSPAAKLLVSLPASAPSTPCDWTRRSPEFSPTPKSFGSLNFLKMRRGGLWGLLSKLPVQRHKRPKFPPRYALDIGPPTLISHTRGQRIDWVRYFSENSLTEVSPNDFDLRHQETPSHDRSFQGYEHYRCFHEKPDFLLKDQRCPDVSSEFLCLHTPRCTPHRCPIQDSRSGAPESRNKEVASGTPEQLPPVPSLCIAPESEAAGSALFSTTTTTTSTPTEQKTCSPLNCVFYVDFEKPLKFK